MGRIDRAPRIQEDDLIQERDKRTREKYDMATPIGRAMGTSLLRMQKQIHSRAAYGMRAASTFNIDLTGKTAFVAGVADRLVFEHAFMK